MREPLNQKEALRCAMTATCECGAEISGKYNLKYCGNCYAKVTWRIRMKKKSMKTA